MNNSTHLLPSEKSQKISQYLLLPKNLTNSEHPSIISVYSSKPGWQNRAPMLNSCVRPAPNPISSVRRPRGNFPKPQGPLRHARNIRVVGLPPPRLRFRFRSPNQIGNEPSPPLLQRTPAASEKGEGERRRQRLPHLSPSPPFRFPHLYSNRHSPPTPPATTKARPLPSSLLPPQFFSPLRSGMADSQVKFRSRNPPPAPPAA